MIYAGKINNKLYISWKRYILVSLANIIIFLFIGRDNNRELSVDSKRIPWDLYIPWIRVKTVGIKRDKHNIIYVRLTSFKVFAKV